MRFNDVGVADISSALYNKWNYLRLGDVSSTYTGSELTDSVLTLTATSTTDGSTYFERVFLLGFLDGNSDAITTIADATELAGDEVDSFETLLSTITKTNIEEVRITIKTEIIR
jgi:hypothetical protein